MVAGVLQAGAGAYCMNCDKADIEYEYYALVVVTSDIAIAIAARGAMSRRSATNATTNNQGGRNPSRMGGGQQELRLPQASQSPEPAVPRTARSVHKVALTTVSTIIF